MLRVWSIVSAGSSWLEQQNWSLCNFCSDGKLKSPCQEIIGRLGNGHPHVIPAAASGFTARQKTSHFPNCGWSALSLHHTNSRGRKGCSLWPSIPHFSSTIWIIPILVLLLLNLFISSFLAIPFIFCFDIFSGLFADSASRIARLLLNKHRFHSLESYQCN